MILQADMYSVGIIMNELFHPFGTEMERRICLSDLRKGRIHDTIKSSWHVQVRGDSPQLR